MMQSAFLVELFLNTFADVTCTATHTTLQLRFWIMKFYSKVPPNLHTSAHFCLVSKMSIIIVSNMSFINMNNIAFTIVSHTEFLKVPRKYFLLFIFITEWYKTKCKLLTYKSICLPQLHTGRAGIPAIIHSPRFPHNVSLNAPHAFITCSHCSPYCCPSWHLSKQK